MVYDYDDISKIYDAVREADLKAVKFMIEKAKVGKGSRVLEIGCGTANYLTLIQRLTQAEVWGIDSSRGMLDKAMDKCKNAVFIEGDAVKLSRIPEASFDLVYMVDVLHHIKDIGLMFKNIRRVLKDNGSLIIFSDNYEHIRNRLTTKYFPETLEAELKRYQDTPEIIKSLSEQGFRQMDSGALEIGTDHSYGQKLVEIASKKGYSMFGLISNAAIAEGIERIKKDMLEGKPVEYKQRAPYVFAVK